MSIFSSLRQIFSSKPIDVDVFDGAPPDNSEKAMIKILGVLVKEQVSRTQKEAQWAKVKMAGFGLFMLALLLYYIVIGTLFTGLAGAEDGKKPSGDLVGIVRVHGAISRETDASAAKINAALRRAFEDEQVKRVVLSIDSPGGSPVEAERITSVISQLREKHKKPVVAVIGNLGASAAYMVAMEADSIVSGRFSLVGSIGAVLQAWDLHQVLDRYDVKQKTFASGDLKAMLNPFAPSTPKADAKAQELVDVLGKQFYEDVLEKRKSKLKLNVAYNSGEVWNGSVAKDIGLVDKIGTLDSVLAEGENVKPYDFGPWPQRSLLQKLGLSTAVQDGVRDAVAAQFIPSVR